MPAEWEPHAATWLAWPKNRTTWPGRLLQEVQSAYLQMISALLPGERVNLLVDDEKTRRLVLKKLSPKKNRLSRLVFHRIKTVDAWIRDWGPIFVKKANRIAFTKWTFNAWGSKYADLAKDNSVVDRIPTLERTMRVDIPMVLEGGSIDVNGRGTLLTTEQCLLNSNRNPGFSKEEIERNLRNYLGVGKVIWLKEGIEGDDTDGHVDDITRFVNPDTVVTAVESDPTDANRVILKENLEILKSQTNQDDKRLRVVELLMPGWVGTGRKGDESERLPASYANFYIANGVVLAPVYSHRNDKPALKILRRVFPLRKVVAIECTALIYGLGSIHCVTQQEPKA